MTDDDDRWDTSKVEFADGRLIAYDKRAPTPRMRHIDHGLGLFRRGAFDAVPEGEPSDLADLYRSLLAAGDLAGHEVAQRFYEVGSPAGLEETRRFLAMGMPA